MTQANRIVLNTLASYGRSLLALGLGLFSTRWVLTALGKEDLGLFGLMGSCIVFVTLINGILGGTIARFYAYAIGERKKMNDQAGKESMTRWFNAAFSIHAFTPIGLMVIVYPIGVYTLQHWLVVPIERMDACIWVFRMVLLSACINMFSVPYIAMYRAKQLIVELSIWEMVRTILMFVFAYMLLGFNGDRLMAYGAFMTVTPSVISIIQMLRARCAFEGCVVRPKYLFSKSHLKPMFAYAFGDLFGSLGAVVRDNGTAFLINVNFGPAMNASFGIANQVSNHTTALSSAMIGALVPAVTTAEGSGDHAHALRLAFRSIKFGVALILVFCIPLILEMDEVLKLWLVNPPEGTAILCRCMLFAFICHKLGWGHQLVILAKGRVVGAQLILGTTSALGLLLSWVLIKNGYGMLAIGISYIVIYSLMTLERAICAKKLCAMPLRYWMFRIILPLTAVGGVSYLVGTIEISLVAPSFTRIIFTSIVTNLVIGIGLMFFVFDQDERNYFKNLMRKMKGT